MRLVLLLAILATASSAGAQDGPPAAEPGLEIPLDAELDGAVEMRKRLRRSRAVLTAGALLLGMGAIHLAAWGSNYCSDRGSPTAPVRSRWMGSLMMGLGVGLAFGGTMSLLTVPGEQREAMPMTRRGRRGFRRGTIGTVLNLLVASLAVGFTDFFTCTAT